MVERVLGKDEVTGSSPVIGSTLLRRMRGGTQKGSAGAAEVASEYVEEEFGQVAEWLKASDCKSDGLSPTEVRILPCPPRIDLGALAR